MMSEEETDDLTDMEILKEIVKRNKMKRQLWKEEESKYQHINIKDFKLAKRSTNEMFSLIES